VRALAGSALLPAPAALPPGGPLLIFTPTPDQPSPQSNKEKRQASQLDQTQQSSSKTKKLQRKIQHLIHTV